MQGNANCPLFVTTTTSGASILRAILAFFLITFPDLKGQHIGTVDEYSRDRFQVDIFPTFDLIWAQGVPGKGLWNYLLEFLKADRLFTERTGQFDESED